MLPYFIAYGLTLAAGVLRTRGDNIPLKKSNRGPCIAFAIIWIFLLGFRHPSMGVDLQYGSAYGYLGRFEYIAQFSWWQVLRGHVQNYETGYMLFNKLVSIFGTDYQNLIFACAAFAIILIAVWICLNSDYPVLSAVIYLGLPCFMMNYSGLRQAMAIAITTMSIELIKKRRPIWFVLVVLLANQFHHSAWIFLFAYPIYHFRIGKSVSVITTLLPAVIYTFRYELFAAFSGLIKENAVPDNNDAFMLFFVFWGVYLFAVLFGHENDEDELGLRNLFFVACLCQAMGGVYNTVIRVGYFYMVPLAVLLPKIIKNNTHTFNWRWQSSSTLIMYLFLLVSFGAFGIYSISRGAWAESNPYLFFWQ